MSVQRRLQAPADLSEFQQAVWAATVNARPANWFGDEHLPILLQYVRHVESANDVQRQLSAYDFEYLADDDEGLKLRRYECLLRLQALESNMINTLARAMRMTQQSLYRGEKRIPEKETASNENLPWRKAA